MKGIYIQIGLLLFSVYLNGQQAFTNNGNLQIHTGASIAGFGNFTNTSSGALVNTGAFYIKGSISNDQSSMAVGTGTLYLNGTSAQAVNGAQPFKTFDLNTNNASGFTLNNNLHIGGTHTYTGGMITTSSTPNYLIYEAGSSYSGNGNTRHVNGWVKKLGSTNFIFPVGTPTYERTVAITNLSAVSEVNCRYYRTTQNLYNLFSPLVYVDSSEYWQIDRISGGTFKIALNWDNSKVPFPNALLGDVHGAYYTGGLWRDIAGTAAGSPATTGTLTLTNDVGLGVSPFTFGFTSWSLPMRIISFSAVRSSGTSFLNWNIENESNLNHYEIERSYNGLAFSQIGQLPARNSARLVQYNFEDHTPLQGFAYYRVRLVDNTGRITYTRTVIVSEKDISTGGIVALNPVRGAINLLNKTGREGLFAYRLYNAGGQLILSGQVNMGINAGAAIQVPSTTASGLYLIELNNASMKFMQKILIEK